jgi:membrane associated rhomboid family serine protease
VQRPPPLSKIAEYPVTGGALILAVVVTLISWNDPGAVEPVVMQAAAFHGEPWRLVSSMLPHGGLFHLGFNLYWVWIFGTILEERLGSVTVGGIVLLTSAGSAAAEYALFYGGIGLSGVVYGLFGVLQILKARDPRFLGALDRRTEQFLSAWFFIAIALDYFNIMGIANAAHAGGWAIGAALGLLIGARQARDRGIAVALNAAWVVVLLAASTVGLEVVNRDGLGDRDLAYRSAQAFEDGDMVLHLELAERVADYGVTNRALWADIAEGWQVQGMPDRAAEAWARSGRTPPDSPPAPSPKIPAKRAPEENPE